MIEQVAENPELHAAIYGEVRKAAVPRFPYIVLYREEADVLLVISVFHTARHPSIWKSRI